MARERAEIQVRDFIGTREEFFRKYPGLRLPPIRKPTAEDEPKGSLHGSWIWGTGLDEDFSIGDSFDTREEAIADGQKNCGSRVGEFFQTGMLHFVDHEPSLPVDPDRLIEDAQENLHGDWHEAAVENWGEAVTPHMGDLELRLNKAWNEWIEDNELSIHGYTCEFLESHEVGPDPDDVPEAAAP